MADENVAYYFAVVISSVEVYIKREMSTPSPTLALLIMAYHGRPGTGENEKAPVNIKTSGMVRWSTIINTALK